MQDQAFRNIERRVIKTRWWCVGCILFSLTFAIWCAVEGSWIGTAVNFFAAWVNNVSFLRNGVTLKKVRDCIEYYERERP